VLNHVVNSLEQTMGDGHNSLFRSQSCSEAEVFGPEIASFHSDGRPSSFHQGGPEAAGSNRAASSEALARTLIISRADPAPGTQSRRSGKCLKRCSDFGENSIRSHEVYAWDPDHALYEVIVRLKHVFELRLHASDTLLDVVDHIQLFPEEPPVMIFEEALNRTEEFSPLGFEFPSQAMLHIFPGDLPGVFANKKVHQIAPGTTEEIGDNRVDLDVARLEELVNPPLGITCCFYEALSIPAQVPPPAHLLWWNEPSFEHPYAQQSRDPLAVGHIGLATGQIPDMARIDQDDVEASFQDVMDRAPINTRALHRDDGTVMCQQPLPQTYQVVGEGSKDLKLRNVFTAGIRGNQTGVDRLFVNVKSTTNRVQNTQNRRMLSTGHGILQ